MIVDRMTQLIGKTPMIQIPTSVTGLKNIDLYAKLEFLNPFGSVKDRVAWHMIEEDLDKIQDKQQKILENSSGNTAKALCAIASTYNIPFKLISAIAKVQETKDILRLLGAEIEELAAASECFDPSDPNDPQYLIEKEVQQAAGKIYFPSQFTNEKNPEIHEQTTAQEILEDLETVDYFIGGLGTTGSTLGLSRAFAKVNPNFTSIGLTAARNNYIPGIRSLEQMWESGLYQEENYQQVLPITEGEAIDGMLQLNRQLAILCGPSAGANFAGSLSYLKQVDVDLTERKKAVFIACDRVEWYLSYLKERVPEYFGGPIKNHSLYEFKRQSYHASDVELDFEDFQKKAAEEDALIIDIRSRFSYQLGHFEGALNMPIELWEKWIEQGQSVPKDKKLFLVCAVGEKTSFYAAYLQQFGLQAYSLKGGMMAARTLSQSAA